MSQWADNTGRKPRGSKGKRVRVMLRGDGEEPYEPIYESDRNAMVPTAWSADTTRWDFSAEGSALRRFDVVKYRIL